MIYVNINTKEVLNNTTLQKNQSNKLTSVKFDVIFNLATSNIYLNSVVYSNSWVRITNSTTIMGYNEWYAFRTNNKFLDFTEFVLQIANKFEQIIMPHILMNMFRKNMQLKLIFSSISQYNCYTQK